LLRSSDDTLKGLGAFVGKRLISEHVVHKVMGIFGYKREDVRGGWRILLKTDF